MSEENLQDTPEAPESHNIIIISAMLDCIKSHFPSLQPFTDNLKTRCQNVNTNLPNFDKTTSGILHERLEAIQAWATERCENWELYTAEMSAMEEYLDGEGEFLEPYLT